MALLLAVVGLVACDAGTPAQTPPIVPGSSASPREVNLITKDYSYLPGVLDFIPGETVLLHVINGGLITHEAVIGNAATQAAWTVAEAGPEDPPPGPTPVVAVPVGMDAFRVVVDSGQERDIRWTVPTDIHSPLILGCHIPGHWAKGMQVPVRFIGP